MQIKDKYNVQHTIIALIQLFHCMYYTSVIASIRKWLHGYTAKPVRAKCKGTNNWSLYVIILLDGPLKILLFN